MPLKALLFSVLLGVAALVQAQQSSVLLTMPGAGKREIWTQAGPPSKPGADSVRSAEQLVTVPVGDKKDSDNLYVWDQTTGNLAATTVGAAKKSGAVEFKAQDFKLIASVTVKIEHSGQPLAAGEVSIDDGARPQAELLDPTTSGVVQFYGVRPGSLKVSAKYKTKAGAGKSLTQLVDAPLKRTDPVPSVVISIPDEVATVGAAVPVAQGTPTDGNAAQATPTGTGNPAGAATTAGQATPPATKPQENANPVGSFIVYLIGIGVAGILVYVGLRYAKQNPDLVQGKLQQLGVDIPQDGDAVQGQPYDPVPAAMPKKPDPPQKILLDDAAPTPLASAPAAAPSSIVLSTGQPSLVSDAGDAMVLPEGETVVGREVGLGLSLVGESTVSRRHSQLVRNGNDVTVTDLGSTNGTFVNGTPLNGTKTLRPGDTVQFGEVRFRYEA